MRNRLAEVAKNKKFSNSIIFIAKFSRKLVIKRDSYSFINYVDSRHVFLGQKSI